jgi:predicted ester cyclase
MSDNHKVRHIQAVEAAYNQGNLDELSAHYAQDLVRHKPPFPDMNGLEAFKSFITEVRTSYPDCKVSLDRMIVEGDWGAVHYTFEGTQDGPSPTTGLAPTHKHVKFTGCVMSRSSDGKVVEEWEHGDFLGLMQQLGAIELPS